jgi:hypothetical protein
VASAGILNAGTTSRVAIAALVEPGTNANTVQVFMDVPHVTGQAGDATPTPTDSDFFLIVACNLVSAAGASGGDAARSG